MILNSHSWAYIRRKTLSKRLHVLYPNVVAALFTIAKTWKQLKRPSTEMDREDAVHLYNEIVFTHYKE